MRKTWRISRLWGALAFAGVFMLAACGGGTESTSAASDLTPASDATSEPVTPASGASTPEGVTPASGASTPAATTPTWGKPTETLGDTSFGNTAPITIGPGMYNDPPNNRILTTVTLCYPGTNYCKTIDNIVVDTNSTGLKIFNYAVADEPQGSLPPVKTSFGSIMGQCDTLSDGYVWGQLAYADVKIGGEFAGNQSVLFVDGDASGTASGDIDSNFTPPPGACSTGATRKVRDSNGILGIRTATYDCQGVCNNTYDATGPSDYYRCGGGLDATGPGCFPIVEMPPMQSMSPITSFGKDNNGYILDLYTPYSGSATPVQTSKLIFGLNTLANNQVPSWLSLISTLDNGQFYVVRSDTNAAVLAKGVYDSRLPYSQFTLPSSAQKTGLVYTPSSPFTETVIYLGRLADGTPNWENLLNSKFQHGILIADPMSQLNQKYAVVSHYGQGYDSGDTSQESPMQFGVSGMLGKKIFVGVAKPADPTAVPVPYLGVDDGNALKQ